MNNSTESEIFLQLRKQSYTAMYLQLQCLVLATFTVCVCTALSEAPAASNTEHARLRRDGQGNWPNIYPESFLLTGGAYSKEVSGIYKIDPELKMYNGYPVYKGPEEDGTWRVYHRKSPNLWVMDFNDVSESWDGTVSTQDYLFSPEV